MLSKFSGISVYTGTESQSSSPATSTGNKRTTAGKYSQTSRDKETVAHSGTDGQVDYHRSAVDDTMCINTVGGELQRVPFAS